MLAATTEPGYGAKRVSGCRLNLEENTHRLLIGI